MDSLKQNERIVVQLGRDWLKDNKANEEENVLYSCLNSYKRFSGILSSQFQIQVNMEDDKNTSEVRFEAYTEEREEWKQLKKVLIKKNETNLFIYEIQEILDAIVFCNQYMRESAEFFLKNRLWEIETLFIHLGDDLEICEDIWEQTESIMEELEKIEEHWNMNEHMVFLYNYLKVIHVSLVYKRRNQLGMNSKKTEAVVAEIFKQVLVASKSFSNNVLFIALLCYLSEMQQDSRKLERNYREYIRWLTYLDIDTELEVSMAYYRMGHYYEKKNHVIDEKTREFYMRACHGTENYRAIYKMILLNASRKNLDKTIEQLKKLKVYLENKIEYGTAEFMVYIYLFKITYNLGSISMRNNTDINNAIIYLQEAEKIFEDKIQTYMYTMLRYTMNDERKTIQIIDAIRDYLEMVLIYNKLTRAYMQVEGIYGKNSNYYEEKYLRTEDRIWKKKK